MGTARYLSYELVMTDDECVPTTASDVHALACVGLEVSQDGGRRMNALINKLSFCFYSRLTLAARVTFA